MPCSRRHKAVKFREEMSRRREAGRGRAGGVSTPSTWWQAAQQAQQYKSGTDE